MSSGPEDQGKSSLRGRIYDCICPEACCSTREPLDSAGGSIYVPVSCGSFGNLRNRIKYPHFVTYLRGFCHGLSSLFLPVGADRSGMAVPHASVDVAKRP